MADNSILGVAQNGIQAGLTGLQKNAANLASSGSIQAEGSLQTRGNPVNDLVEMKMNTYQVVASGKVIQAVDEMLGSLLDEKA